MSNTLEFDELKTINDLDLFIQENYSDIIEVVDYSNVNLLPKKIYNKLEKTHDKKYFDMLFYLSKKEVIDALYYIGNCYFYGIIVEQINKIRIPSSHDGIMDIQEAETTINYLLFNKKMLCEITNIVKSDIS